MAGWEGRSLVPGGTALYISGMKRFIPFVKTPPKVAVIRLSGAIGAGRNALSDAAYGPIIERAFKRGKPDAVAVVINSPGGSPVQSSLIGARLRRLADENEVPLHCFVEDVAASGGYWLACAADQIWVDRSSIIGSIGVIAASFGFDGFMKQHGVERRVHTAGQSKSMWDPFLPEKPEDVERLKALQSDIHAAFIDHVKARREGRLADVDMFGGEIFTGQSGIAAGLADGLGQLEPKMKEIFGEKTRFIRYGAKRSPLARLGLSLTSDAMDAVEERALWARFGL